MDDGLEITKITKLPSNAGMKCPACQGRAVDWVLIKDASPQYKQYHGECRDCKCSFDINSL